MRNVGLVSLGMFALAIASAPGAQWKPAEGPLMTRWAKEVSPENALPEYPRPQMTRPDWLNLNGLWQLAIAESLDEPPLGKDLPDQILVPFPVESALSGVMKRAERLWYRRTFEVPAKWAGKRVLLHFGAVDWEATVYVNGKKMGAHRGGYDSFTFDITEALKTSGSQELVVGVSDPTDAGDQPRGKQVRKPKSIWYTPTTGIWQTAWIEPAPAARIDGLHLVPDVDGGCLRLTVRGIGTTDRHRVSAIAVSGQKEVARADGPAGSEIKLSIPNPRLWSPDEPFLYDLKVQLRDGDQTIDEVGSYFGMRKIEIGKDERGTTRMLLNGRFVFQIGFLDQGFWPDGIYTAPTDDALRYDIEATRQLGMNMARKHVKIEPDRWYYWCDKLGLLVWQDMPSANNKTDESKKQFEQELQRLIEGRRNHPCIIMWVVFNEGWGQHDTERLTKWVKQLDPSRLVNNASGWADKAVGDVKDVHSYPGPNAPDAETTRAAVLGEFGGLGLSVEGHTWEEKTWGYRQMDSADELTRRYVSLMRGVWQRVTSPGLSAAVYTQTTDVETECNGFMTYDRAIIKPDVETVVKANLGQVPQLRVVAPTAQGEPVEWRYTLEKPSDDWIKPDFDDSAWKKGPGGFGTKATPASVVRTVWDTKEIWLRREFSLPKEDLNNLVLLVHHDEDVQVYINGVVAAQENRFTTSYIELAIKTKAIEALKPGKNFFAVSCKQTDGGQYIDVGLARLVQSPARP